MSRARAAILARYRTNMHDRAAAGVLEQWQEHLRAEEGSAQIGGEDGVPVGVGDLIVVGRLVDAGIVDQDRDRTKAACILGQRLDRSAVGDVKRQGHRAAAHRFDLLHHRVGFVALFAIGDDHVGAGFRQTQRDGLADAAARPGDDGIFAGQREAAHCRFSLRSMARRAAAAM
jgi:hypothetical protein